MKILNTIGNAYAPEAKEILDALGDVDYVSWDRQTLLDKIHEYDIAVIGLGLTFDKEVLEKAANLKAIGTATTGLDHIDLEAAKEKGIEVLSLKEETEFLRTITGTAELAWGMLLDIARNISASVESVKNYEWNRDAFRGHELKGKTLGIVGLGRLGEMMARYGNAFGMHVIAYDPHIDADVFAAHNVTQVSFDELIKQSDVVSIHVHLSPETENMFSANVFAEMKPTAYLVNTARGKIVNETDVLTALEQRQIAGYATDVLADELTFTESFTDHPLVEYAKTHTNCIITPHIGGMTAESRAATDSFIAKKIAAWIK